MHASTELRLQANGLTFTATRCGEGPVVLCLHGFPDHRRSFRYQAKALAEAGFCVIAPTMRGYEPSSQPLDADYHAVRLAEDIIGWIDDLGEDKVHLIGHDWGAIASYAAAALAPGRFHSLTTLSVPDLGGLLHSNVLRVLPTQLIRSWYIALFQFPWIPERLLRRNHGAFIETLWRSWSPGWELPDAELKLVKEALFQPGVIDAALGYYRALTNVGAAARLSAALHQEPIAVPTMAITGALDGCIKTALYDVAMRQKDYREQLRVERILGAGHFPHQEQPEVVNALLIPWLKEHTPAILRSR